MTLYDLRELFISDDQAVKIYDLISNEYVWKGDFCDLPEELEYYDVMSIDNIYARDFDGSVCINIERTDDDEI